MSRPSIVEDREVLHVAPPWQRLQKREDVGETLLAHHSIGIGRHIARRIAQLLFEAKVRHDGLGERGRVAVVGTALPGAAMAIETARGEIELLSGSGVALRRVLRAPPCQSRS
jgi:hypothetical protein